MPKPTKKDPYNTQASPGSTQLDPGGMKKAFKTPESTKVDEEADKDPSMSLGARMTRGIKRRLGK